jgi:hypothetical protein
MVHTPLVFPVFEWLVAASRVAAGDILGVSMPKSDFHSPIEELLFQGSIFFKRRNK